MRRLNTVPTDGKKKNCVFFRYASIINVRFFIDRL